jgi:hypothetical protein
MDRKRLAPTQPTVDIGMRLVMPLGLYRDVGMIMDEIQDSVRNSVGAMPEARFEFISFMTNPCKNMEFNLMTCPRRFADIGRNDQLFGRTALRGNLEKRSLR